MDVVDELIQEAQLNLDKYGKSLSKKKKRYSKK